VKYIWLNDTAHVATLFGQNPDYKIPQKMAWVAVKFTPEGGGTWRAHIIKTKEGHTFPTEQQAKDWAQAVILLTQ
jgi:uncharacterized protein YndB with AHSA1/START domain